MKTVLVPLAQSCEELEAVTIIDLLVRAGCKVVTASLTEQRLITAAHGVQLMAQTTLDSVLSDSFDLIVLPGGLPGADYLQQDQRVITLLQKMHSEDRYVAAICAAPQVLETAGLMAGKKATGYLGYVDALPEKEMQYVNQAVVEDGKIITSRGPGTAMDFALTLIERLVGKEKRLEVEASLQRV